VCQRNVQCFYHKFSQLLAKFACHLRWSICLLKNIPHWDLSCGIYHAH
jgi:hypothetical protein